MLFGQWIVGLAHAIKVGSVKWLLAQATWGWGPPVNAEEYQEYRVTITLHLWLHKKNMPNMVSQIVGRDLLEWGPSISQELFEIHL
jgi:hypothetical protein